MYNSVYHNFYAYVCVRGGPNQPLHRDPQWSIVLIFMLKYCDDKYFLVDVIQSPLSSLA
jgi:hypothetical protein